MTFSLSLPGIPRGTAEFSLDMRYRYSLTRTWDTGRKRVCWIGANPSKAGADNDDQTVKKWIGFSRRFGYGSLVAVNPCAFISTDPAGLLRAHDPIGPRNDACIAEALIAADTVIVCWGDAGAFLDRDLAVLELIRLRGLQPFCVGTTVAGFPRHPARLAYATPLVPYLGRREP